MDTDTLAEALLEEAEAIVRAEWLRMQDVQLRDHRLSRRYAELPDTRRHPPRVIVTTVGFEPHGMQDYRAGGDLRAGRWSALRVSPTQRSPPVREPAVPKRVVQQGR